MLLQGMISALRDEMIEEGEPATLHRPPENELKHAIQINIEGKYALVHSYSSSF